MKTILVVGGSKGIGKEIVKGIIEDHLVINISRTASDLTHPNLTQYQLDAVKDDLPELDFLDGLVYCPGTINLKPFSRLKEEDFLDDFKINVLGAARCLKNYEKLLKKSGNHPAAVLFSTVATHMGMPFHASEAVSKSGVEGLTKSLAAEWAPNVRINAIAPTITDTTLAQGILRNETMVEKMKERHPLKKILDPTEVAEMAIYLLSAKASAMTGQILSMDCGMLSLRL